LTAKFPNLPQKYIRPFIRGLFDGDGCVTYTTCLSINFTSNFYILEYLREYFSNVLNIVLKSKNIFAPIQVKGKYGQIHYSGKNAITIMSWLYRNSNQNVRMDRKYERYMELKDAKVSV
jgi:hypothetical protein